MWPDWVIAFVGDGRIALLALAVIGLEALVIVVFMRSRARVGSLILTMASGAGLLGALYAALDRRLCRDNRCLAGPFPFGPCLRYGDAPLSQWLTGHAHCTRSSELSFGRRGDRRQLAAGLGRLSRRPPQGRRLHRHSLHRCDDQRSLRRGSGARLAELKPDVVGCTAITPSIYKAERVLEIAKEVVPRCGQGAWRHPRHLHVQAGAVGSPLGRRHRPRRGRGDLPRTDPRRRRGALARGKGQIKGIAYRR
jgi:hypothetical protein